MKNLVLITSVIHTSSKPLSYSPIRSVFSSTERFIQTQNTIYSIREKIPQVKILLVECSELTEEENEYFKNNCDYFFNVINEPNLLEYTSSLSKSLGEGSMTIKAIEYIKNRGIEFDNLFKITGRYFLNDSFNFNKFNNNYLCFRYNIGNETANTYIYKLPNRMVFKLKFFLEKNIDKMKNCIQYELLFLQFILEQNKNEVIEIDKLGITAFISVCGSKIDYY